MRKQGKKVVLFGVCAKCKAIRPEERLNTIIRTGELICDVGCKK